MLCARFPLLGGLSNIQAGGETQKCRNTKIQKYRNTEIQEREMQIRRKGVRVQCSGFPLLEAFPIQRGGVYCCLIFIFTVITLIIVIIVIIMKEEDYTGVSPEKKYIRIENQRSSLKA